MALWTLIGLAKGKATTPGRSRRRDGQEGLLGMPRYNPDLCDAGCSACAEVCPTEAIKARPDGARSRSTTDAAWSASFAPKRARPAHGGIVGLGLRGAPARGPALGRAKHRRSTRRAIRSATAFRRSLHIRHVDAGSCNGCESELQALNNPFYNLHRLGIFFTPSPRFADLLLVTGPVTRAMEEPLRATYDAMPQPRWVMAVGTCAVSGGIAEGGYACGNGLEGVLPVDVYLPGCPPNPAAIIEALLMFLDRAPQRVKGGRIVE